MTDELKAHIAGEIVKWKAVRERAGIEQEHQRESGAHRT
jgi:hypothetical protein